MNKKKYSLKDYKNREVNLLSSDMTSTSSNVSAILIVLILVVAIGVVGYLEYNVYVENKDLEAEINTMTVEITKNKSIADKQKMIMSVEDKIAMKEGVLFGLLYTNRPIYNTLEYFESVLDGELYISNIAVDSKEAMVISATAISHEAISYTINRLKLLRYENGARVFSDVYTDSISRNEDEDGNILYLFQLNCDFEGGM